VLTNQIPEKDPPQILFKQNPYALLETTRHECCFVLSEERGIGRCGDGIFYECFTWNGEIARFLSLLVLFLSFSLPLSWSCRHNPRGATIHEKPHEHTP